MLICCDLLQVLNPDSDGSSGRGIVKVELQMGSVPLLETSYIQRKASASVSPPPQSTAAAAADPSAVAAHVVAGTAGLSIDASTKALLPTSPFEKKTQVLSAAVKHNPQMLPPASAPKAAVSSITNASSAHSTSATQSAAVQASSSKIAALHAPDAAAPSSAIPKNGSSDKAAGSVDTAAPTAAPRNSAEPIHGNTADFAQAAKMPIDPHSSNATKGQQQAPAKPQLVKTPFSKEWLWTADLKSRRVGRGGTAEVFR